MSERKNGDLLNVDHYRLNADYATKSMPHIRKRHWCKLVNKKMSIEYVVVESWATKQIVVLYPTLTF